MPASLQNRCHLNAAAAAEVMNQGYATPADLMTLTEDGVKDLVNHIKRNVAGVNVPFCAINSLLNFQYCAILTSCMGVPTPPNDYNQAKCDFVQQVRLDRQAWKQDNPDKPKEPKPLKDFKKWRNWWNDFDAYMSRCKGAAKVPL